MLIKATMCIFAMSALSLVFVQVGSGQAIASRLARSVDSARSGWTPHEQPP